MSKQVKKSLPPKSFYLIIISSIKNTSKLPDHNQLNISKQNLNYYVRKLKVNGFIKRVGYGVWTILKEYEQVKTSKKITLPLSFSPTKTFTSLKKNIRSHGFQITYLIPNIKNWENRENYLKKINKKYKSYNFGLQFTINNHKVWLCSKSIVIYTPRGQSYFSETAKTGKKYALYDIHQILRKVERMFKVKFSHGKHYKFRISRQHYARIKDDLARQYNKENKKLEVRNEKGDVWLLVDNSFNVDELETVQKDKADTHMDDVVNPFMNSLRTHQEETGETITISKMLILNQQIIHQQQHINGVMLDWEKNWELHKKVMLGTEKNMGKLSKAIDELRKQIKNLK